MKKEHTEAKETLRKDIGCCTLGGRYILKFEYKQLITVDNKTPTILRTKTLQSLQRADLQWPLFNLKSLDIRIK